MGFVIQKDYIHNLFVCNLCNRMSFYITFSKNKTKQKQWILSLLNCSLNYCCRGHKSETIWRSSYPRLISPTLQCCNFLQDLLYQETRDNQLLNKGQTFVSTAEHYGITGSNSTFPACISKSICRYKGNPKRANDKYL